MSIADKLDLAIKQKETGTTDGAYAVSYKGVVLQKASYMTNREWEAFLAEMPAAARAEYDAGGGDELSEKNGRPPKMASYGSSGRMIYNLSRDKEGFRFEKKLPTTVGGAAYLDGFYEADGRLVCVEAKCREPYTAKAVAVSKNYDELYQFINACMAGALYIDTKPSKCGRNLHASFTAEGERLERFDIKQMICHLLGIATGLLKGTLKGRQIDFIYLLYDPTELDMASEAKDEITAIYERACYECNLIDFAVLFRVILAFLTQSYYPDALTEAEADALAANFTFTLASQDFYPILIS